MLSSDYVKREFYGIDLTLVVLPPQRCMSAEPNLRTQVRRAPQRHHESDTPLSCMNYSRSDIRAIRTCPFRHTNLRAAASEPFKAVAPALATSAFRLPAPGSADHVRASVQSHDVHIMTRYNGPASSKKSLKGVRCMQEEEGEM